MKRSRLSRRLENQSKKSFYFSILGILIILFILVKFGIPLLINFSLFIAGTKTSSESENSNSTSFVAPPVIDPLPYDATSSAQISITGIAFPKQTINLYINDELVDKVSVKDDESFIFKDITLKPGENSIKTKALTDDKKQSNYSNTITVSLKKEPPGLNIDSPSDQQSFSKDENTANVSGKTDPGVKVTVNNFWAIVDSDGNFNYTLKLNDGENQIKIIATDDAGNKTEKEIKVTYSP
ncbi:MAG: Ig-like domain-containing protein [Candidatus Levybacteria bacterium]|nr:Ig-like domain-containing protein [Candidatus Levybacteria bacterium]